MPQLNRIALAALVILTLARFVLLSATELDPDEAYIALCADRPAWHYADSGPLPPLISRVGMGIAGHGEFGHRLFAPLLALGLTLAGFSLAAGIANSRAANWMLVGLSLLPAMTIASTRLTVASCTATFWTVLIWALWRALHTHRRRVVYWAAAGVAGACCVLCHPGNGLLILITLGLLILVPRWRTNLFSGGFLLALGLMIAGLIPLWVWDDGLRGLAQVRWGRALGVGLGADQLSIRAFFGFLWECSVAYTPLLGFGLVWMLVRDARGIAGSYGARYAVAFSVPALLAALALALFRRPDPLLLLPAAVPLLARLAEAWPTVPITQRLKIGVRTTALAVAALLSVLVSQTDLVRRSGMSWGFRDAPPEGRGRTYWSPWGADPTSMQRGWRELASVLAEAQVQATNDLGETPLLIADSPEAAALLAFYLPVPSKPESDKVEGSVRPTLLIQPVATPDPATSLLGWSRYDSGIASLGTKQPDEADQGATVTNQRGRHALFLVLGNADQPVPREITDAFDRIEQTSEAQLIRGGEQLRTVRIFACYDYHGLPL